MNQGFKIRLDELRNNIPNEEQPVPETSPLPTHYDGSGYVRNLCIVWLDGKKMFFNYAYLVVAEFTPTEDGNDITLNFSDYQVLLRGFLLAPLFGELQDHRVRNVFQVDQRYINVEDQTGPVITDILVARNE
ncbi:hypothetical protein LZD49_18370 [Dyadobacter sp. CY261]|uniref:hypothetical protein n=1 Tax=Dyadobacter sp. CY261 TaxID=2907203 RepID=UPI001F3783AD|nr:hypothetical protein [Dyadobacter sp. CY261]MCF0072454.1 hypothetical protein [Dyadobacter sp. CY261]